MKRYFLLIVSMLLALPHLSYGFDSLPTAIPNGTTGQVLTSRGTSDTPYWAAASGGGKLGQVVTSSSTSGNTVAANTWTDAISTTIQPASGSSNILVIASIYASTDNAGTACDWKVVGNGLDVTVYTQAVRDTDSVANMQTFQGKQASPGTGIYTYKLQFQRNANTAAGTCNYNVNLNSHGVPSSFITLVEILP